MKLSWWSGYPTIILVLLRIGKVELRWWKALWWPFMIQGRRPGHVPRLLRLTQHPVLLHWGVWERSWNLFLSPRPPSLTQGALLGLPECIWCCRLSCVLLSRADMSTVHNPSALTALPVLPDEPKGIPITGPCPSATYHVGVGCATA